MCYFGVNVFVNSNENERYGWCLMNRYVFLLNVNLCAIKCRNAVLFLYLMCQNVPHIHLNDEYMNAIDDLIYFCLVKQCWWWWFGGKFMPINQLIRSIKNHLEFIENFHINYELAISFFSEIQTESTFPALNQFPKSFWAIFAITTVVPPVATVLA